jgi:hypothetical protein
MPLSFSCQKPGSCPKLGSVNSTDFRTENQGLRRIAAQLVLMLVILVAGIAQAQTNPKHFFWAPGQPNTPNPSSLANDLIYHGGNAGQGAIGRE